MLEDSSLSAGICHQLLECRVSLFQHNWRHLQHVKEELATLHPKRNNLKRLAKGFLACVEAHWCQNVANGVNNSEPMIEPQLHDLKCLKAVRSTLRLC